MKTGSLFGCPLVSFYTDASDTHLFLDFLEALDGEIEVFLGVARGDLGADPVLAMGTERQQGAARVSACAPRQARNVGRSSSFGRSR